MTTPTLSEFAAAFEKVRERYPGAPTALSKGYAFRRLPPSLCIDLSDDVQIVYNIARSDRESQWVNIGNAAALALCVTTALENPHGSVHRHVDGKWGVYIGEKLVSEHPSLPSACLAALRGIGGGE
jgi:hypothetical protein